MSNIPGQCLPGELFGALVATLVFVTNFISIVLTCAILRKTLRRRETRNRCVETIVTSSNTAREICELRRVDNNEEIDGNSNRRSSGFGEAVRESHTDEISSYNSEIQRRLSNQVIFFNTCNKQRWIQKFGWQDRATKSALTYFSFGDQLIQNSFF